MKQLFGILIAAILVFSPFLNAQTSYYVAVNGNDSNSGTDVNHPFLTLAKAYSLVTAGDYIYMRSGTHIMPTSTIVLSKNGTSSAMIHLFAYENETPVIQFDNIENSTSRGIVLDGDYWYVKGITIEKAGDNGMLLSGNHNTIEECVFRYNHDSGLQLSRYNTSDNNINLWPSYNLILNCEAHDNMDSDNEDADGFAAKLTCGYGNVFRGCVSHHNVDDGWDLYTKSDTGPIGPVTIEDCIAHDNGTLSDGVTTGSGDKNGFKLGSSANHVDHIIRRCIAFNNGKHGFTDNGNTASIEFSNNTSYNNGDYNFHTRDGATHIFKNNISFDGNHTDRIVGDASAPNAFTDTDTEWQYSAGSSDFETMTPGPDNDPVSNGFLNLKNTSPLIDAGVKTDGILFSGSAPDLGAIEYGNLVLISVTGVSLIPENGSIAIYGTLQIETTITPSDASNKSILWSSGNDGIASVSSSGLVTGLSSGETVITATTVDGGFSAVCSLTVTTEVLTVPVAGITVAPTSVFVGVDETTQLTGTISPVNASDKAVQWNSSDTDIATVDENGLVTGVAPGTATVTVTTDDGGFTAECEINVTSTDPAELYTYSKESFEQDAWPTSATSSETEVAVGSGTWKIKNGFHKENYAYSGSYVMALNSNGYAISPKLVNGAGTISYYARSTSSTARIITIQVSQDGTDYTTLTTISTGGGTHIFCSFDINSDDIQYVKIVEPSSGGAYFDDMVITVYNSDASPVELTAFAANVSGSNVELSWQTATEVNSYGYDVERKKGTGEWEKVGFVAAAGNSNSTKNYSYTDENLSPASYLYRLKQIDINGGYKYSGEVSVTVTITGIENESGLPTEFSLAQNYPNPFNPETKIRYQLPSSNIVTLKIYNIIGEEVATLVNREQSAGRYEVAFNAKNFPSGLYFYRLSAGNFAETKKMIVLK